VVRPGAIAQIAPVMLSLVVKARVEAQNIDKVKRVKSPDAGLSLSGLRHSKALSEQLQMPAIGKQAGASAAHLNNNPFEMKIASVVFNPVWR